MKQIVLDPTAPTMESVNPRFETNIDITHVTQRIIAVNTRLNFFSKSTDISHPLVTSTIVLFRHGNTCNGNADISAIAMARLPHKTATSDLMYRFEFIESRKLDFTLDP